MLGSLLFALVLSATMALSTNYEGTYRLTKLYDSEAGEITLPRPNFQVRFVPAAGDNQYQLNIKLGNSLGGTATVSESSEAGRDAFSVGPMRSTRMMAPPEINAVERAVLKIVPGMETIYFDASAGDVLVLEGPTGSMQCQKSLA